MHAKRRMLRSILALGIVAAAAVAMPAWSAGAATHGPSATISPKEGISDPFSDGSYVTVTWKGFAPNAPVAVRECQHGATSLAQCSKSTLYSTCGFSCPGDWLIGTSDKDGNGFGSVPVATGSINTSAQGDGDIPGSTFACGPADPCDLWVTNDDLDATLTSGVFLPIGFQPAIDACSGGSGPSLRGSGPASGNQQFRNFAIDSCQPPENLDLNYTMQNSSAAAIADYEAGAPFAVTTVRMDSVQQQALETAGLTAGYAPILASGEVFGFRLFDPVTHNQITHLTLTPDLLARIFTGQLKYWNIPAIKALNPGVRLPGTIAAIGRGEATEETYQVTKWLFDSARSAYEDGGRYGPKKANPYTGPASILPVLADAPNPVALVTGERAVAWTVRTGGSDYTSLSSYGTIGYMDSSFAAQYGLPTVTIKFPNGKRVAATSGTISRAIGTMHADRYGVRHMNDKVEKAGVWPMPVVSYMVIPRGAKKSKNPPDQATGDAVAALVKLAVSKQSQGELVHGYAPLPPDLVKEANTAAGQIWTAPPLPPPTGGGHHRDGGSDPGHVPGGQTGGSGPPTGSGGTVPPVITSSTPPSVAPSSAPSAGPVVPALPALPAPSMLVASSWSKALPMIAVAGLGCLVLGAFLLFGGDVRGTIKRSSAKVKQVSPLKRKRKQQLHSVDGPGRGQEAA
jgi:ABC-type phosphate transport system substrate-binding protein